MDNIYYLVHVTNNPNCLNWTELRTTPFNTNDQFPGVYLTMITKDNIDKENIFPGKYIIILSKKLLFQKNYHVNLTDYNGIISEENTYFPWNLDKFMSKNRQLLLTKNRTQNEVVFHDNIDMKYCCGIICILKKNRDIKLNKYLLKIQIENEEAPDKTKEPFLCYPFEDMYTGIDPLPTSSNEWYEMMSKVCNVNIDDEENNTPEYIIEKIKDNANNLYENRDEQNIEILEQYSKSKTKQYYNKNTFGKRKKSNRKISLKQIKKYIIYLTKK